METRKWPLGARRGLALESVVTGIDAAVRWFGDRWGARDEERTQQEHRIGKIETAVIVAVC